MDIMGRNRATDEDVPGLLWRFEAAIRDGSAALNLKRDPERPSKTGLEEGWMTSRGEETANRPQINSR